DVTLPMRLQSTAPMRVLGVAPRLGFLARGRIGVDFEGHQMSVSCEIFLRLLTVGRRANEPARRIGRLPFCSGVAPSAGGLPVDFVLDPPALPTLLCGLLPPV